MSHNKQMKLLKNSFKFHKINLNCGGSYTDSPEWIKKATINPVSEDDKCFQFTGAVALNHEVIGSNLKRISKRKPFINKCNWKGISYPSGKDDWNNLREIIQLLLLIVIY